jgi:hypothetical protein
MNAEPLHTVRRSETTAAIFGALLKAQGELKNPPKDSVNPHYKSRYADLATVREAVLPAFLRHGLAVVQCPCELGADPALTTLLIHESGEWVETTIRLRPAKADPQGVGSALTYARRYALQSVAGVAAEDDDDGNAASRPAKKPDPPPRAAPARLVPADSPADTPDALAGLITEIANLEGESFTRVMQRLFRALKTDAVSLDDLTPADLARACAAGRKKVAELRG